MSAEIVVFGREPVPGRVKTRLARAIGAEAAAAIYAVLLRHTLDESLGTGLSVTLALAEPPSAAYRPPVGVRLAVQRPGTLGERMAAAFADRFAGGATVVVLVGSDVPRLARHHLLGAAAACTDVPVALGPSPDGGYWVVAQRAPGVDLFSGVPWSVPGTLEATRAGLRGLGVAWRELEQLDDLDTATDLARALGNSEFGAELERAMRRGAGGR
jgi:rSAM/selenodomain-associated transferase 1